MRRTVYFAACFAACAAMANAQVVLDETFDDGNAATRFDTRQINPASAAAIPEYVFNFNYGAYNYVSYASGSPTAQPIPSAPGSVASSTTGLRMRIAPGGAGTSTIQAMGALPIGVTVANDFKIEGYMWMNYNGTPGDQFSTQGGSGSTEYMTVGIRRSGDSLTGPFPAGTNSPGYAFTMTGEGGTTNDVRMHNTDLGDDGPAFQKRTGAWFAGARENRYNLTTGDLILTNPAPPATPALIPDTPDNLQHSYYRSEVFPSAAGFEIAGTPAKKWVKFEVEQHGRISTYTVNGKAVSVLFNTESFSGTPQFGYFDRFTGFAPDTVDPNNNVNNRENQFMIYDNLKATQLEAAAANDIVLTKNYAAFGTGGTYSVASAATLSYLEIGGADAVTINGAGTLTLGESLAAVQTIGGGTHVISKPVVLNADAAISVVGAATTFDGSLEFTNLTFGSNTNSFNKNGTGTLKIPNLRADQVMLNDGKVQLTGVGPTKASKVTVLDFGYLTPGAATPGTRLDLGKTVLAVDWIARNTADPTKTNNPFNTLLTRFSTGFNNGAWNGPGIMSSAPELLEPSSMYAFRFEESSIIGYVDGSTWGATGIAIDASAVLMGFTFKADTNLDQAVNFDDLLRLVQNYNATGIPIVSSWVQGDSNADGNVNFDDLLALAQQYGGSVSLLGSTVDMDLHNSFSADWALAQSMVPEPTSLSALALGSLLVRRRR